MLDVAALVDLEVGGAGAVLEPVALEQALALRPRDRGLRDLDGVQAGEQLERVAVGRPSPSKQAAVSGVGAAFDLAAHGLDEAVPEAHVAELLGGVAAQLVVVREARRRRRR